MRRALKQLSAGLAEGVRRVEQAKVLDGPAAIIQPLVHRMTQPDEIKAVLSGAPLGHRLHPLLTDIPIGCWTSAWILDLVGGKSARPAAQQLTALGVLSAVPTVASGLSDWSDTQGSARRVGVVHLAANSVGIAIEYASWTARRKGHHVRGATLGMLGIGVLTVAGYLGGHLAYVQRAGVDVEVPLIPDDGWYTACAVGDLVDGEPIGADIDEARVVVVRLGEEVYAMAAVCNHAGGPLDRGKVIGGTIQCPWHGSKFCLADGTVERGPAAAAQPAYETRRRGDVIEVRRQS